jgi:hypothetical protein
LPHLDAIPVEIVGIIDDGNEQGNVWVAGVMLIVRRYQAKPV